MSRSVVARILPALLASLISPAAHSATLPAESSAPQLPALVVANADTTIISGGSQVVRLARPSQGVALDVKGSGPGGTLAVQLHGGVEVTGFVTREALGVVVCEPGPLGDHFYLGRGNELALRSAVVGGRVEVAGEVRIQKRPYDAALGDNEQLHRMPFRAEVEVRRLCTAPLPKHAGTDADPIFGTMVGEISEENFPPGTSFIDVQKGVPLTLLDRPAGLPLHQRAADRWGYTLARITHAGKWDRVAAGDGPYLLGWIPARPVRKHNLEGGIMGGLMLPNPAPDSLNTDALKHLPLHELPAGVELRQFGAVVARLTRPGYARVSALREGWRYAVVAVDEDVVAEGWLDPARIGPAVKDVTKP